jgi:two-component system, NtrC family, sensor kinase
MKKYIHLTNLLSFRLFIFIFFILTVLTVGFSLYYIEMESAQYEEIARQCASRTSSLVAGSTRNAMLLNQKEKAFEIISDLVQQEGIEKICLYNKQGEIIFSTSEEEMGKVVGYSNRPCATCHKDSGGLRDKPKEKWYQIMVSENGYRSLSYLRPIENEEGCSTADCHAHSSSITYVGVLCVVMSLEKMDRLVKENEASMISVSIVITILLGLAAGIFLWIGVHVPVKKLIKGTHEISSGNLDYHINNPSKDEMGVLANSFNQMTEDLKKAKDEITTWSSQLENRVKEKSEELEKTQRRNLQIEKMASLGQLSATVAHELNNPISGILTYSKLIQKKLGKDSTSPEEKDTILKHLKMIETESARSGEIVKNMLLFSRQGATDVQQKDINRVINSAIDLISHHLELHNIQLIKELQEGVPAIYIDENQIKQALIALFVNAVEAMENEGILGVTTEWNRTEKSIWIYIRDTGKGIPEGLKNQIFEPFFTTKNAVKGVGLGLSSVYAIINNHKGDIVVESEVEKGTTFIVKLPLKSKDV